jgi:hypothetical protein
VSALIVVERETFEIAQQKTSFETSYYVSSSVLESDVIKPLAAQIEGEHDSFGRINVDSYLHANSAKIDLCYGRYGEGGD